jgi:glycosyltransferase involved in cell wall biosynthesis
MKLLIEASPLEQDSPSGVNYFTQWLAKSLEKKTDSVFHIDYFFLNFLRRKPLKSPLLRRARPEGRVQQIALMPQRVYAKLVAAAIAPPLLLRKSNWVLYPNFYIWPSIRRTKKAVIIHDIAYLVHPEYVEDKNRAFLEKVVARSIRQADLIISNSEFTTNELVEKAGAPRQKIVTISIPVDKSQFEPSKQKGRAFLEANYGISKRYILSLGNLEPRKDLATIINAYCLLPKRYRDGYSLVLAGKWGWKTEALRELIAAKQAAGFDIILTGRVSDDIRATLYRHASVYAIASFYEGFGMPLLEALHCGIPTVSVDIPVLREVGDESCLWSRRDPVEFSRQLTRLMADKGLSHRLSHAGKKRSEQFSWDNVAETIKQRLLEQAR